MLHNLGTVIAQMLRVNAKDWGSQAKVKRVENRNLMSCLLNAPLGYSNWRAGRVSSRLRFVNVQTHPLFESPSLTMGETIVDNYESILSLKQ